MQSDFYKTCNDDMEADIGLSSILDVNLPKPEN